MDKLKTRGKMNVLFIAVDDLRPQLGCYGRTNMITPNIDKLGTNGVIFTRAYCQQAVCGPTRASLLSGCRPETTTIFNLEVPLRKAMPDVLSLPEHFKKNGYETFSIGKIYHHADDDMQAWTVKPFRGPNEFPGYMSDESLEKMKNSDFTDNKGRKWGPAYECVDVPDNAYPDGKYADHAIEELRRMKNEGKPFFMGVGFVRPHLPFNAPKKYWDMYTPEKVKLAENPFAPKNATEYSLSNFGELRMYQGMPKKDPVQDDLAYKLVQGYQASVSYTDAQLGRLLNELDALGLRENTIVILWGDHGWKLGEHGEWCKHTNFENDTNAPLIMSIPGMGNANKRSDALVEFVDIYPTLSELCGLPLPQHLEGTSFVPLLEKPEAPWKNAAFSQFPRKGGKVMGYTMKTADFRYTEWKEKETGKVLARELYDHRKDYAENNNVSGEQEYSENVRQLGEMMKAGWKSAMPEGMKK
ncbi:MAG TPA: iduronate sulfatase [Lentisphaeria bacterium]|nr:MAG: iduronate sulfatase [Lentisphaerae bacterium GWF2_49_21]HBC89484.1 iduronate sulfatase [Lentisphaeria bacterium]